MKLEVLEESECLRLLGTAEIGRVVYSEAELPSVVPVNFVLYNDALVFRTGVSGALAAAVRDAVVAFEVDEFDVVARTGWSVTAFGYARVAREVPELAGLGLGTWVVGAPGNYVVVVPGILRGRRIPGTGPVSEAPNAPGGGAGPGG